MTYTIYQLPGIHPNAFMNHKWAQSHGGIDLNNYRTVYSGIVYGSDADDMLEQLFVMFNINFPEDYRGRSLSVSDIVKLDGFGTYFCDSIGWKRLDGGDER